MHLRLAFEQRSDLSAVGRYGPPFLTGSTEVEAESLLRAIDPRTVVVRTAPGPAVTLVLPIRMRRLAAGFTFTVEGTATDDFGNDQPFERLGRVAVRR